MHIIGWYGCLCFNFVENKVLSFYHLNFSCEWWSLPYSIKICVRVMVSVIYREILELRLQVQQSCFLFPLFTFKGAIFFSAVASAASFVLCIFSPIHICLYLIVHHNNALLFLKPNRKWKAITKQKRFFHYSASNPFKGVYPLGVLSPCYRGAQLEERVVVGIIKEFRAARMQMHLL